VGVRPLLMRLAAHYFLDAKNRDGYPLDPVARFHLGNGARLERINWQGDISAKGLREAHGLMCNYRYELKDIEKNHEAYENECVVAASRQVHNLLKLERGRSEPAGRFLQLPGLRSARSSQDKEEAD
jgi:malonyl-CoA decarboxylase